MKSRSIKKVLFANPPFEEVWKVAEESKTAYIGYLYIASVLEQNGIDVQVLDGFLEGLTWEEFLIQIEKIQPDIVGLGTFTPWANNTLKAFKRIKKLNKDIITIAGGQHFSYLAALYAKDLSIDYIVIGEGEYTVLELVQEFMKPTPDIKNIKGLAYYDGGEYIQTPPRPLIQNLDELPMPAYHLIPLEKSEIYGGWKNFIRIKPSRGCPNRCTFCGQWKLYNGKFRSRSSGKILDEIDLLYTKYKMNTFSIDDEAFNANRKRTVELVEGLIERKYDISIECSPRADHIVRDKDLLPKLADIGLSTCVIGIETFSDEILKNEHKGEGIEQIKECFKLLREHGIGTLATYMVGRLGDTRESIKNAIYYIEDVDPDAVLVCALMPWPGSPLWDQLLVQNRITDFNFLHYDLLHSIVQTDNLTQDEIADLGNWLLTQYYTNPTRRMRTYHCGDPYWRHSVKNWYNHQEDFEIKVPEEKDRITSLEGVLNFE